MGPGSDEIGLSTTFVTKWSRHLDRISRKIKEILQKLGINQTENIELLETLIFWLSITAVITIFIYLVCICKVLSKNNKKVKKMEEKYKRLSQFFPGIFHAKEHAKEHAKRSTRRGSRLGGNIGRKKRRGSKEELEEKKRTSETKVGFGPHIPLNCPNRKMRMAIPSDGIHARLAEDLTLAIFPSVKNIKCHDRGLCTRESHTHLKNKSISKRIRTETMNSMNERRRTESIGSYGSIK